jgi:hypothetical protein
MIQFKPYPVFIVYSKHWYRINAEQRHAAFANGDDKLGWWLDSTGRDLQEIMSDNASAESLAYEKFILKALQSIDSTQVGTTLLTALRPDKPLYIIPGARERCPGKGSACAWQYEYEVKAGGGYRLWYNSEDWTQDNFDDVLFHELCHVYRGEFGRRLRSPQVTGEFPDIEEFYAFQLQNLLRSSRKKNSLQYTYLSRDRTHPSYMSNKSSIYQHIVDSPEHIMALKHLLNTDTLARLVSNWQSPEYNPFRDYKILERLSLERFNRDSNSGLRQFPNFIFTK